MSFQTHKTFVHLQNTNEDIFDEIRELSDPPIDSNATTVFKAQKRWKDIVQIVHSRFSTWAWYGAAWLQTVLGPKFSAWLNNCAEPCL